MRVIPPVAITSTSTHTRASAATYINASGVLSSAGVNVARFTYDPVTLTSRGMMVETAATNMMIWSEVVASWTGDDATSTSTANAIAAPDGATTADRLIEAATSGGHYKRNINTTAATTGPHTFSLYYKKGERSYAVMTISVDGDTKRYSVCIDLDTGVLTDSNNYLSATGTAYSVTDMGGGWWRVSVTAQHTSGTIMCIAGISDVPTPTWSSGLAIYTGDITKGLYIWGGQLETGSIPTSYISTAATTVTRSADIITGSGLLSSTIAEPDTTITPAEANWSAATNYATGTLVVRTTTHKIYERLTPGGVDAGLPESTSAKWLEIGPTNKWAMFDSYRTTGSSATGTVTVVLTPAQLIDAIAIVGCVANSVTIDVTTNGVNVFHSYDLLTTRTTTTWYTYFIGAFTYRDSVVKSGITTDATSVITLTFIMPASAGSIGNIIIGNSIYIGEIQVNPSLEALNFSKIDRDIFGNTTLVQRRSVPKTSQTVFITKSNVNTLIAARELLNAVPAMWIGIDDNTDAYFEPLLILGIYKEFSISMDYPDHGIVTLQLEEM